MSMESNVIEGVISDKESQDAFDLQVQVAALQARGWRDMKQEFRVQQARDSELAKLVDQRLTLLETNQEEHISKLTAELNYRKSLLVEQSDKLDALEQTVSIESSKSSKYLRKLENKVEEQGQQLHSYKQQLENMQAQIQDGERRSAQLRERVTEAERQLSIRESDLARIKLEVNGVTRNGQPMQEKVQKVETLEDDVKALTIKCAKSGDFVNEAIEKFKKQHDLLETESKRLLQQQLDALQASANDNVNFLRKEMKEDFQSERELVEKKRNVTSEQTLALMHNLKVEMQNFCDERMQSERKRLEETQETNFLAFKVEAAEKHGDLYGKTKQICVELVEALSEKVEKEMAREMAETKECCREKSEMDLKNLKFELVEMHDTARGAWEYSLAQVKTEGFKNIEDARKKFSDSFVLMKEDIEKQCESLKALTEGRLKGEVTEFLEKARSIESAYQDQFETTKKFVENHTLAINGDMEKCKQVVFEARAECENLLRTQNTDIAITVKANDKKVGEIQRDLFELEKLTKEEIHITVKDCNTRMKALDDGMKYFGSVTSQRISDLKHDVTNLYRSLNGDPPIQKAPSE